MRQRTFNSLSEIGPQDVPGVSRTESHENDATSRVVFTEKGPLGIVWVQKTVKGQDTAVIQKVKPGGAASKKGLKPGMCLHSIGSKPATDYHSAVKAIRAGSDKPPLELLFKGEIQLSTNKR